MLATSTSFQDGPEEKAQLRLGVSPCASACAQILTSSKLAATSYTIYALQTKILERGTKDEMRSFEVPLKSVITRFGLRTIEMSIENPHFNFVHPS